jgi:phage shock protein C
MFCTKCGVELRDDDRYCSRCGSITGVGRGHVEPQRLMLDKENKKIAGVCAGFARLWDVDVTLIRVLWLVIAFSTGFGFIAYVVSWIVIPSDHGMRRAPAVVQSA